MRYQVWALVALVAYTLFPPLVSVATQDIPSNVAAVAANLVLVAGGLVTIYATGGEFLPYMTHDRAVYMWGGGVFLAIGILAYYRALSVGPVSVVTPIFGMFIVTSSLVSILFFNESLTRRKGVAIFLAMIALLLLATE
jgi:transporter family protein